MAQLEPKFMMRLPARLHARIKRAARVNGRSMNGEIVHTLDAAYPDPIEPESVNERLLQAALLLAGQWSAALEGMGGDPSKHPGLQKFHQEAQEAMEAVRQEKDNG